ncbi:MAG: M23 family metallopeptidase [Chloroflexi bacterium]|nr:M23 family metallopeptidase [Chloroflexota bacterium]
MRLRLVALIVLAAMVVGAVVTAAFGSDNSRPDGVLIEWIPNDAGSPMLTTTSTPAGTPEPQPSVDITGLAFPIEDGCLPDDDNLMPGAPREYRGGTHEGVDVYDSDNCAYVGLDTEVVAMKSGIVVRADWGHVELTAAMLVELEAIIEESGGSPEVEDAFRGRQVWIEHADGTVTRYAHLEDIAEDVDVGVAVAQGEHIGYVGDSGTPESVTEPGTQVHLHFEIRIGESYLGAGLDAAASRALYQAAFSP